MGVGHQSLQGFGQGFAPWPHQHVHLLSQQSTDLLLPHIGLHTGCLVAVQTQLRCTRQFLAQALAQLVGVVAPDVLELLKRFISNQGVGRLHHGGLWWPILRLHRHYLRTFGLQFLQSLVKAGLDLRVVLGLAVLGAAPQARRHADAQPPKHRTLHIGGARGGYIAAMPRVPDQGLVQRGTRQKSGHIQAGGQGDHAGHGVSMARGFEADHTTSGRRVADGAAGVGARGRQAQTRRHRRTRSAAGTAGHVRQMPGVARRRKQVIF